MNQADYRFIEGGTPLYPIDEAEDFYDPFSDLSLFLSKKIKGEIEESGSSKSWSGKIEVNLLAKILPEFKEKFPKYRLGASALKKMWEKVSYYYEKIQGQRGAVKENGALNLKYMIRENLKAETAPYHLPPYTIAEHIAVKLSECIATFEGTRPKVDHLTKIVWAVQKHLLKGLSSFQAKSPYDEYDKLDKLIVKTQLETSASEYAFRGCIPKESGVGAIDFAPNDDPIAAGAIGEECGAKDVVPTSALLGIDSLNACSLEPGLLKREILKTLSSYNEVKTLAKKNELTSTLSMILAEKLYHSSLVTCHFSLKERKEIESFVRNQIEMGKFNQELTSDEHRVELIQRILALYTIAAALPKNVSEKELRAMIGHIGKEGMLPPDLDQALFVFINAELHLMGDAASEDAIFVAYKQAITLPCLSKSQLEQFELLIWKMIEEGGAPLSHIPLDLLALLEKELANVLIDNPKQSFRMIISNTVQFFKKVNALHFDEETVQEKVDTWVAQNDMLIRSVHFDPKTPLLSFLEKEWQTLRLTEDEVNHETFIDHMKREAPKHYPLLASFEEQLEKRLWILYKYLWYNLLTDGSQSTYDRFILWHKTLLKGRHPEWTKEKLTETLEKLSDQLLPFVPSKAV
ncbi:hypothetical protein [Candidatus Neptunochlamydia vexilliferae]|uniref:hypothetical protein n=1 Tax=Candidatus Neptunichlamydia vexilliferae TaxID=1651774 RepID=UPI001890D248|nr:hypothetical protein [Candidatus Neptunochlamydia vexilliferae]